MTSQALRCLARVVPLVAFLAASGTYAGTKVMNVRITDLVFEPAAVTVTTGDDIEWVNDDFIDHTVTTRGHGFDVTIPAGGTRRLTLERTGTYEYYCRFHPGMTGKIIAK
jgi:plastocyanin